jgi:hypothetical protein
MGYNEPEELGPRIAEQLFSYMRLILVLGGSVAFIGISAACLGSGKALGQSVFSGLAGALLVSFLIRWWVRILLANWKEVVQEKELQAGSPSVAEVPNQPIPKKRESGMS